MNTYRLLNINDLPILQGTPYIKKVWKDYPDKIYSFGNGQSNGSYTTLRFSMPLTYAGETQIEENNFELYKIPDKGISGKNLFTADLPLYLMLIPETEDAIWYLICPHYNKNYVIKRIFNKYMPNNFEEQGAKS